MKLNLEKIGKKNICLVGLMGSGKSLVGKMLSKDLEFKHFDSDFIIEKKTKKTIKEIFSDYGEQYFRKIEEEIIISLLSKKNCVFSLGGGSILSYKTRQCLKKNSITIFLKVDIKILYDRVRNSKNRPLISNSNNIKDKLTELYQDRKKYYKNADLIIDNSNKIKDSVIKIKEKLLKYEKNYN